jgi:hypothetical protein
MRWLALIVVLTGCSVLSKDRSGDPKTCRERAANHIASIYPDPAKLTQALDGICGVQESTIFLPTGVTTTTGAP